MSFKKLLILSFVASLSIFNLHAENHDAEQNIIDKAKEIIDMYPQKRSALGPLLYLAQEKDGYISNDSIVEISNLIGITEVQVKSVASFYSMYKEEQTGKYLLSVCKSLFWKKRFLEKSL